MAKKKLHIHAESMDDGGYVVKSHKERKGGMGMPMGGGDGHTEKAFPNHKAASSHMAELMAAHSGSADDAAPSDNDADDMYQSHPMRNAFGPRKH
jgi:hypothetical protein